MILEKGLRATIQKQKDEIARLQKENNRIRKESSVPTKEYINLVLIGADWSPHCEEHGAMNCVAPGGTLFRCLTCGIGIDLNQVKSTMPTVFRRIGEKTP